MTATALQLTSLGMDLDMSPEGFGELRDSSDIETDGEALRERMREDGYLYMRGYLDRDVVLDARRSTLQMIADAGHVDLNYPLMDAIAGDNCSIRMARFATQNNQPLMNMLYAGRMMDFYTLFLGGEVRHFDYTWLRAVMPGPGTAPHYDIVYMGRGTTNLYTSWTPIGDVDYEQGGLMILEGSHRHQKLRENYGRKDVDTYCVNRRGEGYTDMGGGGNIAHNGWLSRNPVKLRERLGGRWLTRGDFQAGDFIAFSMYTCHCSLDNRSNRIRLSSDTRYQLASEPVDERWIGEDPIAHGPAGKREMIC